jgi:hypothetical protein
MNNADYYRELLSRSLRLNRLYVDVILEIQEIVNNLEEMDSIDTSNIRDILINLRKLTLWR